MRTVDFESTAFNRSATSPLVSVAEFIIKVKTIVFARIKFYIHCMKNRTLATVSFILSLMLHIALIMLLNKAILESHKPINLKIPKQYFVDIITLKQPEKAKHIKNKEKHKIAANIEKRAVAQQYGKQEQIPVHVLRKTPRKIGKINNKKIQQKKVKKIYKNKYKGRFATKPRKKQKISKTIKIVGNFYNPKAIISNNKNNIDFLSGTYKKYRYKNTNKEATISLGTQSLKYASYMQHIKDKIQNVWVYPQEAQENGQQGRLLILFSIDKQGNVVRLSLLRSSGYPLLDKAAMEAIKDASPFPPLPKRFHIYRLNIYATFLYKLGFYYVY